ncbi:MAG TPA: ABC transporter substrate-binding protein [Pseudolabrys sp.]|nr:ABC transporter substrate-binding protein [Pseudolabrys sp.]
MTRRPAALVVFLFVATLAAPARAEPVLLRYGAAYSTLRSIYALPIVVADRQSFFQREGLDFKVVVPIPGGSDKMIDALHDGTVDITHVAVPFLIRKALAGSDAVAIAAEFNNPIYSLLAQPGITNFAMLKGKRIGFADPDGTISMSIRKLLAMHGLRETDYSAKIMEGTPARLNCLKRGECDAVVLGQPQDMAAQTEGFRLLGLSTDATPAYLYTVTAARRSWAESHKDTLVRYLRALAAAFQFIRDERNRNAVTDIISDTTGVSPAVAASVLDLYFVPERGVLPHVGEIDMNGMSQVIIMMAEAGLLAPPLPAPENFVDRRYLQAAGAK